MNPKPGAGEAVPKKATPEAIADAMRNLEGDIRELMHMADITAESMDKTGTAIARDERSITYRFTLHEYDQLCFLINNVSIRANTLERRFSAAWKGEQI